MRIEEVMTREPRWCRLDETLDQACRVMWDCDCGVVPVVDHDARVVAMLTDRDACMAALHQGKALHELPVSVAMSKTLWCVRPDEPIDSAERKMRAHQVRRLPVTDFGGRLVGILSLNDIAREAESERSRRNPEVATADVAETLAAIGEPQHANVPSAP